MTGIKICGLSRREDILAVNEFQPEYIGFVFARSRRQVSEEAARQLRTILHPSIRTVGVFVNETPKREARLYQEGIIDIIQLHGQEEEAHIQTLKTLTRESSRGEAPVIKAVSMNHDGALVPWQDSSADYLLLDNGAGGTGKAFDHRILASAKINKPFFLAGGISGENAAELIRKYHPFALDVSSGAETEGVKDKEKIKTIIQIIREEK